MRCGEHHSVWALGGGEVSWEGVAAVHLSLVFSELYVWGTHIHSGLHTCTYYHIMVGNSLHTYTHGSVVMAGWLLVLGNSLW